MTESLTQNSPESPQNSQQSSEDEINLIDVLGILVSQKFLIFLNIFIFSLVSIVYVWLATPTYQTEVAFLEPSESFIPKSFLGTNSKNDEKNQGQSFYTETNQTLYFKFLTRIQSYKHQKKVFDEGEFLKKFSGAADNTDSPKDYFLKLHESISLKEESQIKKKGEVKKFEKPFYLWMTGPKPEAMSEFLNTISLKAVEDIKKETLRLVKMKIEEALRDNGQKTKMLTFLTQEKLKETQTKIAQENFERLRVLTDSLNIAKSLKIKKNNFSLPGQNKVLQMAEVFDPEARSRAQKIPIWFLYGELALEKEIKTLKSKINDRDYMDNIAKLKYKYKQLEALKRGPSNGNSFSHNIDGQLNELKLEKMKLESMNLSLIKPEVAVISQPGITPSQPIKPKKFKTILIGIGLGLLAGLLTAFFSHAMRILRKQEKSSP